MNKYSFNILWSEEDGEYVATCPAFPGLSALGETEEEALAEAKVALGLFIKTCEERGIPLPEPEVALGYSGQFRVRLAKQDHRRAAQMAAREGVSLNQFVANAVAFKLGATDLYTRLIEELMLKVQDLSKQVARNSMVVASFVQSNERHGTQVRRTVRTSTEISTERTTYSQIIDLTKGN
jgi:predicted RNase H-like HicB family nuclease